MSEMSVYDLSTTGKKPQFILAVSCQEGDIVYDLHEGLRLVEFDNFVKRVYPDITIKCRDILDGIGYNELLPIKCINEKIKKLALGDTNYRQVLPYTVFKLKNEDKFFTYRRTKKVGESRLAGNCSIGIGGHIDLIDVVFDDQSKIDLNRTISVAVIRELNEELNTQFSSDFITRYNKSSFYLLKSNANDVGKVHLGFVRIVEVDKEEILGIKEDELEDMGFLSKEEILDNKPEDWTNVILNTI